MVAPVERTAPSSPFSFLRPAPPAAPAKSVQVEAPAPIVISKPGPFSLGDLVSKPEQPSTSTKPVVTATAPVKVAPAAVVAAVPKPDEVKPAVAGKSSFSLGNVVPKGSNVAASVKVPAAAVAAAPKRVVPKPSVSPAAPKPTVNLSGLTTRVLSESAKKAIASYPVSLKAVEAIDNALVKYNEGSLTAEDTYRQLIASLDSKDAAFAVFPDVIGSLPRGEKKSALNRYYQQQAF